MGWYEQIKSFFIGQLSGVVEPIAGVLGALVVSYAQSVLPYALGFAAGAMIFVVVTTVPEAQKGGGASLYFHLGVPLRGLLL